MLKGWKIGFLRRFGNFAIVVIASSGCNVGSELKLIYVKRVTMLEEKLG